MILTKADIAAAWAWVDVPEAVADWLTKENYPGGKVPYTWWSGDNLKQDCCMLTGNGEGHPAQLPRQPAEAIVQADTITIVTGTLLCRMYDGHYHSWTSDTRHGHPVNVRSTTGDPPGTVPVAWVLIPAADILPTGGSAHGIGSLTKQPKEC